MRMMYSLVCDVCRALYPHGRPVKVGEAWTDGEGRWIAYPVRRNGLGGLGPPSFLWLDPRFAETRSSESAESRRHVMEHVLARPMPGEVDDYVTCLYTCRHKHVLGGFDADDLIGWLELARQLGERKVPLPEADRVWADAIVYLRTL